MFAGAGLSRKAGAAGALVALVCALNVAGASGAQQIGMTMVPSTIPISPMNCLKEDVPQFNTATLIQYQRQDGGTPAYTVPAGGGVVTSWAHTAPGFVGFANTAALQILRPLGGAQFQVAGQSSEALILPGYNSFPTRIPVQSGDFLGLSVEHPGNTAFCQEAAPPGNEGDRTREIDGTGDSANAKPSPPLGSTLDFGPAIEQMARLDVAAIVEPDADHDGFGDETQDPDHGAGAPPAAAPPVAAPKKCKKGRKLRKGKCVKKKKKKKG